jgi:hypothetical protein
MRMHASSSCLRHTSGPAADEDASVIVTKVCIAIHMPVACLHKRGPLFAVLLCRSVLWLLRGILAKLAKCTAHRRDSWLYCCTAVSCWHEPTIRNAERCCKLTRRTCPVWCPDRTMPCCRLWIDACGSTRCYADVLTLFALCTRTPAVATTEWPPSVLPCTADELTPHAVLYSRMTSMAASKRLQCSLCCINMQLCCCVACTAGSMTAHTRTTCLQSSLCHSLLSPGSTYARTATC